jgi:hypothetical protein
MLADSGSARKKIGANGLNIAPAGTTGWQQCGSLGPWTTCAIRRLRGIPCFVADGMLSRRRCSRLGNPFSGELHHRLVHLRHNMRIKWILTAVVYI